MIEQTMLLFFLVGFLLGLIVGHAVQWIGSKTT